MTNSDDSRQSILSVPAKWSELYFDIFVALCAFGELFVICYVIIRRPTGSDALDIAADILLRLAAVPIVAGLQAYIIMRARDLIMKTWERYEQERMKRGRREGREEGREEGRQEGIEIGTQRTIRRIRERLAQREVAERSERDVWLDEILSELSENGNGKSK